MSTHEFLRNHPAKRNAHYKTGAEVECIQKSGGILTVIRHRVRTLGRVTAPETALIIGQDFEILREWTVEYVRLVAQVSTASSNEEEPWTRAMNFVVDLDVADADMRHSSSLSDRETDGKIVNRLGE